jgi:hypothetical protein
MEKIMSKIEARVFAADELTESELDNVSSGEITCHSTNYSFSQTMQVWFNCMGLMGLGVSTGA